MPATDGDKITLANSKSLTYFQCMCYFLNQQIIKCNLKTAGTLLHKKIREGIHLNVNNGSF